jgi:hypothetical protein
VIPAVVAGRRGPRAVAAGEAWVPAGSVAAGLAVVVAGGAAADFEAAVEVGVRARRSSMARGNNVVFWRIGYVSPGSELQT